MTLVEEVLLFSRDYVNSRKERTFARKKKIQSVYKELTGEDINGSCSTCYIEALFKIIDYFDKSQKTEKMAQSRYLLKQGVLLQAFGDTSKTCTNANLTDELAEWHLANNPGVRKYFAVIPGDIPAMAAAAQLPPVPPTPPSSAGPTIIVPPEKKPADPVIVEPEQKEEPEEEKAEVKEEVIAEKKPRQYPSRKNKR